MEMRNASEDNNNSHHVPMDDLVAYLNTLVAAFEEHPDTTTKEMVFNLLQGLDALHREAFQRLAAFLEDHQSGHLLGEAAQADRLLRTVFELYDLWPPQDNRVQVEEVLAKVRPYIESHGGQLNVLAVEGGVVHLEMGGACQGCPGSSLTLQRGVERVLREDFPAFEEIVVHEPEEVVASVDQQGLLSFDRSYTPPQMIQGPAFEPVGHVEDFTPEKMRQVEVGDQRVLLANVEGEIYALGDACPNSILPLSTGALSGFRVICPWHGEEFDVRNGKCLEKAGRRDEPRLPVYPVAVNEGEVLVATNVAARSPIVEGSA